MTIKAEIIFGKGEGQIVLQNWNGDSLKIKDVLSERGLTASFQAQCEPDQVMPETDSLCLIREIGSNGLEHVFTGRYEQEAKEIQSPPWNYQFQINSLIDFCRRDEIEDYYAIKPLVDHIEAAMKEGGAMKKDDEIIVPGGNHLSLLALQKPIPGDDGIAFPHDFKLGNLEGFLDSIVSKKKARWKVKPVKWVDYLAKTSGSFGLIQIIIDGATENRAAPGKLNPNITFCPNNEYLSFMGKFKEVTGRPVASRFICNGRNGRKIVEE